MHSQHSSSSFSSQSSLEKENSSSFLASSFSSGELEERRTGKQEVLAQWKDVAHLLSSHVEDRVYRIGFDHCATPGLLVLPPPFSPPPLSSPVPPSHRAVYDTVWKWLHRHLPPSLMVLAFPEGDETKPHSPDEKREKTEKDHHKEGEEARSHEEEDGMADIFLLLFLKGVRRTRFRFPAPPRSTAPTQNQKKHPVAPPPCSCHPSRFPLSSASTPLDGLRVRRWCEGVRCTPQQTTHPVPPPPPPLRNGLPLELPAGASEEATPDASHTVACVIGFHYQVGFLLLYQRVYCDRCGFPVRPSLVSPPAVVTGASPSRLPTPSTSSSSPPFSVSPAVSPDEAFDHTTVAQNECKSVVEAEGQIKNEEEEEDDMDLEWLSHFLEDAPYRSCFASPDLYERRTSESSKDDHDRQKCTPVMVSSDFSPRGVDKEANEEAGRESEKKGNDATDAWKFSLSLPYERYESLMALIMDQYEFL